MVHSKLADIRFNSGVGALLCNRCSIIIAYGFVHEDKYHFCEACEPHAQEWALDELSKQTQEWEDDDENSV